MWLFDGNDGIYQCFRLPCVMSPAHISQEAEVWLNTRISPHLANSGAQLRPKNASSISLGLTARIAVIFINFFCFSTSPFKSLFLFAMLARVSWTVSISVLYSSFVFLCSLSSFFSFLPSSPILASFSSIDVSLCAMTSALLLQLSHWDFSR